MADDKENERLLGSDYPVHSVNYKREPRRTGWQPGLSLQQTLRDIASAPERLWVVLLFVLVAVIGSALMGLALGYSSPTILNFRTLYVGNESELAFTLNDGIAQQGLFGVRHHMHCFKFYM